MKLKRKMEGNHMSMINGVLFGTVAAIVTTLLCAAIAAMLIVNGKITENKMKYFAFGILLLSAFIGTFVSCKSAENKLIQRCGIVALVYAFLLVSTAILIFDGSFANVGISILMILFGCLGTCLICMRQGKRKVNKRVRIR